MAQHPEPSQPVPCLPPFGSPTQQEAPGGRRPAPPSPVRTSGLLSSGYNEARRVAYRLLGFQNGETPRTSRRLKGRDRMTLNAPRQRLASLRQLFLIVCATAFVSVTLAGCSDSFSKSGPVPGADFPKISAFLTKPSDRFLVDIKEVSRGHPLLGVHSPHPHGGAHVHFDNSKKRWPNGKDVPSNYPAIYAVADGVVGRVDTRFGLRGGNDRYGLDLIIAKDKAGSLCRFCYSIEPMCPEPSESFYKKCHLLSGIKSSCKVTTKAAFQK